MVYNTCSVNRIIAQIYRDIKPSHSGWINDAIEWIADAIDIMKVHQGYKQTFMKTQVIDYRVKLPCNLNYLLGVEHNHMRLQRTGSININNEKCSCLDNLVCHPHSKTYSLNPNYIITSFKEGEIIIYYKGLEIDCDGFPYVIDEPFYRQALIWYVLRMMLLRGFKHQTLTFADADALWEKTYPKAQNACNMFDIDGYELFKKSWTGLVKNTNLTNQFFNNEYDGHGANGVANKPGTLVESFPLLGTNLNNL